MSAVASSWVNGSMGRCGWGGSLEHRIPARPGLKTRGPSHRGSPWLFDSSPPRFDGWRWRKAGCWCRRRPSAAAFVEGFAGKVVTAGEAGVALGDFREQGFQLVGGFFGHCFRGSEGLEVLFHQGRDRSVPARGGDAGLAVSVLIKGESDVFHKIYVCHGFTVSQGDCLHTISQTN